MRTQINSDKNINLDTRVIHFVEDKVNRALSRFAGKLTRIEVHLSDVNSHKSGTNDKRCVVEARPARHRPLSATNRAPTVTQAVRGALDKMRSALETFFACEDGVKIPRPQRVTVRLSDAAARRPRAMYRPAPAA